jgi:hypothetical protein
MSGTEADWRLPDSPALNWNEIKKLLEDAYRLTAPKRSESSVIRLTSE